MGRQVLSKKWILKFTSIVAVFAILSTFLLGFVVDIGDSPSWIPLAEAFLLMTLCTLALVWALIKVGALTIRTRDLPNYESELVVYASGENHNTFSIDRDFRYLYFSDQHAKDIRRFFDKQVQKGQYFLDALPGKIASDIQSSFVEALDGKHVTVRRKFGKDYFQLTINPMYNADSEVASVSCHFEDITGKIEVERQLEAYHENLEKAIEQRTGELQEQHDFFQKIIDEISNLIFVRDDSGKYVLVNKSAEESFPEAVGPVLGKTTIETHHDEQQARTFMKEDKEILLSGKKIFSESIFEGKGGVEKFLFLTKSLLEVKGKRFILGVHTDVTELKKQERQLLKSNDELKSALAKLHKAQDSLVESEKLASLGQLTAGLAHEINNPINYVAGNISPLLKDFEDVDALLKKIESLRDELTATNSGKEVLELMEELEVDILFNEIRNLLEGVADGTARVKELMNSLKNLSRQNESTPIKMDINKIIVSTLALIRPSISSDIKITSNLEKLPVIQGSPGEISQVLLNIVDNAIFAMDGKGELKLNSRVVEENICVEVQDSGRGIPPSKLKVIFEPFYTTKEVGEGTGLGLAISHQIINKHQGQIQVESKLDQGTIFKIFLPVKEVD